MWSHAMAVFFQSTPTSNTLAVNISIMLNGYIVANIPAGQARVLTTGCDAIMLINPGLPPVVRNQNPVAAININPGNIAYISNTAGPPGPATLLQFAPPNGVQTTVRFS
jgi:hypothetical protein